MRCRTFNTNTAHGSVAALNARACSDLHAKVARSVYPDALATISRKTTVAIARRHCTFVDRATNSTSPPVSTLSTLNTGTRAQNNVALIGIRPTENDACAPDTAISAIATISQIIVVGVIAVTTPTAVAASSPFTTGYRSSRSQID